jgi:tetratricopeptide (TPR) repeat protein
MNSELLALENEADQLKSEGKNDEAIAKLQEALEKDETFVRAHLALSVLYHKLADYEKSVAHAERAVELEPEDAFNVAALSVTYQRAFEGTRDPIYIQKAEEALARGHGH